MRTLEELHPVTTTQYFLAAAGIIMFCTNPVMLLSSLIGAVLFFLVRNGIKNIRQHGFFLLLFLILTFVNPLISHNGVTVLFVLNDNPITLESLLYGANSSVMIIAVLYWLRSFSQIMTSEKLLCVFGTFSPKIALILSMTLRFIPLLNTQAQKVSDTQKALGFYKSDNAIDSLHEKMRVFNIVMTWALENGIITANSMTARGSGLGRRTHFSINRIRMDDIILMLITVILAAVSIAAVSMKTLDFTFYPAVQATEPNAVGIAGLAAYALLALLPTILQIEVNLRWKYLQSKI